MDNQNNIIAVINELFLNKFPGSTSGNNEDIVSHEESLFAKFDPSITDSLKSPKLILGYPEDIPQGRLSKKFDDLLWNYFDIFEFSHIPLLKVGQNFTSLFQQLDRYDLPPTWATSSIPDRETIRLRWPGRNGSRCVTNGARITVRSDFCGTMRTTRPI